MTSIYATYYEAGPTGNSLTCDDVTKCADEPNTESYSTIKSSKTYNAFGWLKDFDYSNVQENEKINTIIMRFKTYWNYNSSVSNIHFDLYNGDTLLKENIYTVPSSSYTLEKEVKVNVPIEYNELADLKVKIILNMSSAGVTRSFKLYGLALDVGYEEVINEKTFVLLGSNDASKIYLGSNEVMSAYLGENKIYG